MTAVRFSDSVVEALGRERWPEAIMGGDQCDCDSTVRKDLRSAHVVYQCFHECICVRLPHVTERGLLDWFSQGLLAAARRVHSHSEVRRQLVRQEFIGSSRGSPFLVRRGGFRFLCGFKRTTMGSQYTGLTLNFRQAVQKRVRHLSFQGGNAKRPESYLAMPRRFYVWQ